MYVNKIHRKIQRHKYIPFKIGKFLIKICELFNEEMIQYMCMFTDSLMKNYNEINYEKNENFMYVINIPLYFQNKMKVKGFIYSVISIYVFTVL